MPMFTYFKNSWLSEKDFSEWLIKDDDDKKNFKCKWCSCTLSLSNMGRKALTVHMNGAGHRNKRPGVYQIQNFSIMLDQAPVG